MDLNFSNMALVCFEFIIGLIILTLTYFGRGSGCPLTYDQCVRSCGSRKAKTEFFDFDWKSATLESSSEYWNAWWFCM
jgi:hypothetical protein